MDRSFMWTEESCPILGGSHDGTDDIQKDVEDLGKVLSYREDVML